MRILAVVVTFYPDKELLEKNISAFIGKVEKVLIWENTPESEKLRYRFIEHEKVEYYGDGINSISHGLNFGWKYAKSHGYDYLLTMDQDSIWENYENFQETAIAWYKQQKGIYSPFVIPSKSYPRAIEVVDYAITSGMLISIEILDIIGGYDESFVVDGIDIDICLNAKEHGFYTYVMNAGLLKQNYGNPVYYKLGWHIFSTLNYPPSRLLQIYKNHIILLKKHHLGNGLKKEFFISYLIVLPVKILMFEDSKLLKLCSIGKGIIAGLKSKN